MAAVKKPIYAVLNDSTQFGIAVPKFGLVFDETKKQIWRLSAAQTSTGTLAGDSGKILVSDDPNANRLYDFKESVLDRFDPTTATPVTPSTGDRYISLATANGWTINEIYEWNGSAWVLDPTNLGSLVYVEDESKHYIKNASGDFIEYKISSQPDMEVVTSASDGQTAFTTTISMTTSLAVFVDGIQTDDYVRTDANTLTLTNGVPTGTKVKVISYK
jgi:hypothetical protein